MPTKTSANSTRSYTGSIVYKDDGPLQKSYRNWQMIYSVGHHQLSAILGSYYPIGASIPSKVPESVSKMTLKGTFDINDYRTSLSLINWFPLEHLTDENAAYAITPSELLDRFAAHWDGDVLGNFNPEIIKSYTSFSEQENCAFIDRRSQFLQSGLNPVEIQNIILGPKKGRLNYQGAFAKDTSQLWRGIISSYFWHGEKGDPVWDKPVLNCLIDSLEGKEGEVNPQFLVQSLEDANLWPIDKSGSLGRGPGYLSALNRDEKIDVESYRKKLKTRREQTEEKQQGPKSASDDLKKFIMLSIYDIGLLPENTPEEIYIAAYSMPCGRIMSHRSNSVRRLASQHSMRMRVQQIAEKQEDMIRLLEPFCKSEAERLKIKSYSIRPKQANGLKYFLKFAETLSLEESLKATMEVLKVRSFKGSSGALFTFLYENGMKVENEHSIAETIEWHDLNERIQKAKIGALCDQKTKPMHPQFGKSKPAGEIKVKERYISVIFKHSIVDGKVVSLQYPVQCSRFVREILNSVEKSAEVPRNTIHHNPEREDVFVPTASKNHAFSFSPYQTSWGKVREGWKINISAKIEYPKTPKWSELENSLALGIDLGQKMSNLVAFSVINPKNTFEQVECGPLDHKVFSLTSRKKSVFRKCGDAAQSLLDMQDHLQKRIGYEDRIVSKSHNAAVQSCAKMIKRLAREELDDDIIYMANCLCDAVSPHFRNRINSMSYNPNQGGLTFERLGMLLELKKMISTIISLSEEHKFALKEDYQSVLDRIEKKFANLRKERARICARMIVSKAVEIGAGYICLEDLDRTANSMKSKRINRGLTNWCLREMVEMVKREAATFNIAVLTVNAKMSSHSDLDGNPAPRMESINPMTLPDVGKWGLFAPSIKSIGESLATYMKASSSDTEKVYCQAAKEFLDGKEWADIIQQAKEEERESMLVPRRGGEYIQSKYWGLVKSDFLAAHVVGLRGLSIIQGHGRKTRASVTPKTPVALENS